jgi:hypothetical protein
LFKIFYLCLSLDKIVEIKFLSEPYPPPLLRVLYLPCQICGSGRASPSEGIIVAMQNYQKGTVSLGEAAHDPQVWNALKKINYRLNRPKIGNVGASI